MSHKGHIKAASSHSTSAHAPSTCKVSPQLAGFHGLNHSVAWARGAQDACQQHISARLYVT